MNNLHARRAQSFGSIAARYAQHRPDYPDQAVAWALGSPPDGVRVIDLAAGTGKLTEAMLRCGIPAVAILAVEPDADMRAELSRRLPGIVVRPGSAEHIPAEDAGVTRFSSGRRSTGLTPAEIARVLRPGGVLAALGNVEDDSVPWVAELTQTALAQRSVRPMGGGSADVPAHPAFDGLQRRRFRWCWPRTIDSGN